MIEYLLILIFFGLLSISHSVDKLKERMVTIAEWQEEKKRFRDGKGK